MYAVWAFLLRVSSASPRLIEHPGDLSLPVVDDPSPPDPARLAAMPENLRRHIYPPEQIWEHLKSEFGFDLTELRGTAHGSFAEFINAIAAEGAERLELLPADQLMDLFDEPDPGVSVNTVMGRITGFVVAARPIDRHWLIANSSSRPPPLGGIARRYEARPIASPQHEPWTTDRCHRELARLLSILRSHLASYYREEVERAHRILTGEDAPATGEFRPLNDDPTIAPTYGAALSLAQHMGGMGGLDDYSLPVTHHTFNAIVIQGLSVGMRL